MVPDFGFFFHTRPACSAHVRLVERSILGGCPNSRRHERVIFDVQFSDEETGEANEPHTNTRFS